MRTPQRPVDSRTSQAASSPKFLAPAVLSREQAALPCPDNLVDYVNRTVLEALPNDLTRMIYLASLRDCNSGLYLHPELSHQRGVHAADGAFRACHEQVFRRLLSTGLAEYVDQLHEYIRYTRGEILITLKTWKSLQAYRATVPVSALATSAELYFLNVAIALEVVGRDTPQTPDLVSGPAVR
jgi:hypothetical protein